MNFIMKGLKMKNERWKFSYHTQKKKDRWMLSTDFIK